MTYEDNELSFDVPLDWTDESLIVFSKPDRKQSSPTVMMTKEPLRGQSLADHVKSHLAVLCKANPGLRLIEMSPRRVAGKVAGLCRVAWKEGDQMMEQTLIYFPPPANSVRVTTFSLRGPALARDQLAAIMGSIRFKEGSGAG